MNSYLIKKAACPLTLSDSAWNDANIALVNLFPWANKGYKPYTTARVLYSDLGICVKMETDEKPLLARFTVDNSNVYKDSCMEFFFGIDKNGDYLSFEINPNGAMLLSYGSNRKDRTLIDFDKNIFEIEINVCDEKWELKFFIPFSFVKQYFGRISDLIQRGNASKFYGNFYKCGDETEHLHYGCWSKIETLEPDFHRPEFFGEFVLEKGD